jgi:hypothetical protein
MRKNVEESTGTIFGMVRRTDVDVEDEHGTNARRTGTTNLQRVIIAEPRDGSAPPEPTRISLAAERSS